MLDLLIREINKDKDRVERFIIENATPKVGIYILADIDKPFRSDGTVNYLVVDKKTSRFVEAKVNGDCKDVDVFRAAIAKRDSLSKLLNAASNKAIDAPAKKILSTTYQALTINAKTAALEGKEKDGSDTLEWLIEHICEAGLGYYRDIKIKICEVLDLKNNSEYCLDIVKDLEYAESEARLTELSLIEAYIRENLGAIIDFAKNLGIPTGGVIKIFFTSSSGRLDDSIEAYKREEAYYFYRSLLNADGVEVVDNELVGTTVYGFNNNAKKTGIKPLTMNINLRKYLTMEKAMDYRTAYQFLQTISENNGARAFGFNVMRDTLQFAGEDVDTISENITIEDFTKDVGNKGLIFRLHFKEKYIVKATTNAHVFNPTETIGKRKVPLKNYFGDKEILFNLDKESAKAETVAVSKPTVKELLARIGFCWYKNLNTFSEYGAYGIGNESGSYNLARDMEGIYGKYSYVLDSFFKSKVSDVKLAKRELVDYVDECIRCYVDNMHGAESSMQGLRRLLNYKLSLIEEFKIEGNDLIMADLARELEEKMLKIVEGEAELDCDNEVEYFYALGQLAFYAEYQVQKTLVLSPFKEYTNKKTVGDLTDYLTTRLDLYGYNINPGTKAMQNLASKILLNGDRTLRVKNNLTALYGGFLSNNVFLRKKEENAKTEN